MSKRSSRRIRPLQASAMFVVFIATSMVAGALSSVFALPTATAVGALTNAGTDLFEELPEDLAMPPLSEPSTILRADGTVLATFYYQNRQVVPLAEIAPIMQKSIIALEDRRFRQHQGIDPTGLIRALISNTSGGDTQGASTLTQQFVKNYLVEAGILANDPVAIAAATGPTIARKLREAKLALALERRMSKDDILAGYLNIAQFGPSVYGIEAASQYYFSKSAKDLTLAEAALLAGIPQSPNSHDPVAHPENATKRREEVLAALLKEDVITKAQYDEVNQIPVADMLNISEKTSGCAQAGHAAYFCQYVEQEILNNEAFGATRSERDALLKRGGLTITTTLDPQTQQAAADAVHGMIPAGDASGAKLATAAIEPGTGRILALAQNTNFGKKDGDLYTTELAYTVDKNHGGGIGFQIGSTFKTFTLATWFQAGKSVWQRVGGRSATYTGDDFHSCEGPVYIEPWEVNDLPGKTGARTVREATALSINNGFLHMATQLDLCDIAEMANKVGIRDTEGKRLPALPGNMLGSGEATPLALANAYATFAAGGTYCTPIAITKIVDRDGNELSVPGANCSQVMEPEVAGKVTATLHWSVNSQFYRGVANVPGHPVAGKTGTTDENADTWFVGYTPQIAAATWLGHSEARVPGIDVTINGEYYDYIYGSTIAAPTWARFMAQAMEGREPGELNIGDLGAPPVERPAPRPSGGPAQPSPAPTSNR
ncbi:transglycosylase domain-containing protein [Buchananella hordeovulneris]|uniref:Uncharacterized protein n=3 Tax=Buchananella hordeovulneris TaxID=52770 RepID=A0A1Q5PV59_9ACTO|nr:transglycosylase domain-containing protein [Buchananella hordeovulneris]OKL51315.1 hypothetical protein BSZ40_08385 [Buchananella hordeovulneris]RRD42180.1 penicillin-binding protein [Buchananella hordeovulneris]RRD49814.1 penicillin-binding protein [Buchananella hordeovulneris]